MTTFTRIPEEETPSINVDVSRRLSKIGMSHLRALETFFNGILADPNIYGGFME